MVAAARRLVWYRETPRSADTLGHEDVGAAGTVGVGDDAGNGEADLAIEVEGVLGDDAGRRDGAGDVGVQVNAGEGGGVALVVGAYRQCEGASLSHTRLQIRDERAADSPPLVIRPDGERVQLPDAAA